MAKKYQWQLMTIEQIAITVTEMREAGNDASYRQQKSYYRKQGNTTMIDRFAAAETLAKGLKDAVV